MKKTLCVAILASMLFSSQAFAQVRRDAAEKAVDTREIRQDKAEIWDSQRDLAALQTLLGQWDNARGRRAFRELDRIELEVRRIAREELAESRVELADKNAEVARSASEVRSDRREQGANVATGAPPRVVADDRTDRMDDRADLAKDQRDAAIEADRLAKRRAIARDMAGLAGRYNPGAMARKRQLMLNFIALTKEEIAQDRRELKEDKAERREDRREMREDVRQGR